MSRPISDTELKKIRDAVSAGRKLEAIKLYREATGADLLTAKNVVESLEGGTELDASTSHLSVTNVTAIQAALFAGNKIGAIKIYRQATGDGLKESKDFIEAVEVRLRETEPGRFTNPPAKGCGAMMFVVILSAVFMWVFFTAILS